jgi:hypothetical protein
MGVSLAGGVESEAPAWEPEPFELPLEAPAPRKPTSRPCTDDDSDSEPVNRVIIIDLA